MFKLLNTASTLPQQIAHLNALAAAVVSTHTRGLAHAVASGYAFGWYNYQHDSMALTRAFTERQIHVAPAGTNQWLPIARVTFGAFDAKGTKVSFMGLSGLIPFGGYEGMDRYAGAMRLLFEEGVHPNDAEEYILNFKGGLTGMVKQDREKHGIKRAPRKPVSKARKAAIVQQAKALPTLPAEITPPVAVASSTGHFAQAWVYIENGQVFLGGIVPNSENDALKAADAQLTTEVEATPTYTLEGVFEATPEMVRANTAMQRNFAASLTTQGGEA